MSKENVIIETRGRVRIVTINRPEVRNAVDYETSKQLLKAFEDFESDHGVDVGILTGADGHFCAGADLHAIAEEAGERVQLSGPGPMGPTRLALTKPVIAAVDGYAVAGGLELALWCDLRVAGRGAIFGVFCRRFGVPLVDGGTVRLPRIIGHGRAMDLILTGRAVDASEADSIGLVNRVAPTGQALEEAITLAEQLIALPQVCLRNDRLSAIQQWGATEQEALLRETEHGLATIATGETAEGAARFSGGAGRHGRA